jgi:predicted amidohydrolase
VAEGDNPQVEMLAQVAGDAGIWIAFGLPVAREDGRWANRTLLFDARGEIAARYDKIHMFDVELATGETWRESAAYAPGEEVVTVENTPLGRLGLAICYDIRFPALFEELGRRCCDAIAIPAAFTVPTGRAHWHLLQRARAVEASAFVVAAAQVGEHADGRRTYGHSLVIDPWGEVLLDMGGAQAGLGFCDIDLARIAEVRGQLPSLANKRAIATSQPA